VQCPAEPSAARSRLQLVEPSRLLVDRSDIDAAFEKAKLIARPMPLAAPVTIATCRSPAIASPPIR